MGPISGKGGVPPGWGLARSAACTVPVSQTWSSEAPTTRSIGMAGRRWRLRSGATKWRSSSTKQRNSWLSWGCWRPVRPGREGGSRSGSGREDGAGSPVFAPASVYCNIPMICSSVNLVRFIVRPLQGPDSNRSQRRIRGAGQAASLFFRLSPKVAKPAHQFDGGSIGHQVAL
jgi:hypothetical protein